MRYFTDENGPKGRLHENEFWLFSNTKMNVTNRAEKVDKKWGYLSSVRVPTLSFGSEILQKMHFFFFNFVLQQEPKSVKVIYIYASESSHCTLSENDMVYRGFEPPFMRLANIISKKMPI